MIDLLAELGSTVSGMAKHLVRRHVEGRGDQALTCPGVHAGAPVVVGVLFLGVAPWTAIRGSGAATSTCGRIGSRILCMSVPSDRIDV
ncbi:hypothetical protein [Actinomadura sp. NPDC049753]|uniref:hypothetical protein n=1 Tax=Actinomadura sp. NPDC049753 TaxID=3154739 RepID=UPI003434AFA0